MEDLQSKSEMSIFDTIPLLLIAGLSGYGLRLAYSNITRLQQYERQSEKAAEWSNTVAERLRRTRTTQASGAITVRTASLDTYLDGYFLHARKG